MTTDCSSEPDSYCERFSQRLLDKVSDPGCALRGTVLALAIAAVLYVVVHWLVPCPPPDFSKVVVISQDARFHCYYRDDVLDRFFSRASINEWKQRMDEKGAVLREEAVSDRQRVLLPLQQFIRNSLGGQKVIASAWTLGTNVENSLLAVNLPLVKSWLEKQTETVHSSNRGILGEFIRQVEAQNRHEAEMRSRLVAEIEGLKANLSFDWLFIDGSKWIIEVFFWCTFGVLANTFISLIYAAREGRYDAKEFLLVVPKAALAPVLALVIISWWATGMSESKISFVNLPYFLVLSFSLGFVTESLYVKIKDLGNLIVGPSAAASAAKLEAAAKRETYRFVHPAVAAATLPAASNLEALREQLRAAAKAGMERGLVAQLSADEPQKP